MVQETLCSIRPATVEYAWSFANLFRIIANGLRRELKQVYRPEDVGRGRFFVKYGQPVPGDPSYVLSSADAGAVVEFSWTPVSPISEEDAQRAWASKVALDEAVLDASRARWKDVVAVRDQSEHQTRQNLAQLQW